MPLLGAMRSLRVVRVRHRRARPPLGDSLAELALELGIHRGGKRPNVLPQLAPGVGNHALALAVQRRLELCQPGLVGACGATAREGNDLRSEEHTSELQ